MVILKTRAEPFLTDVSEKDFFRMVKAGFSAKRKQLRSSLSGGLAISKQDAEALLQKAGIGSDLRAEALSLDQWVVLTRHFFAA
ncbi:Ribosomal RNA small subunit methyltransferase A [compost metagenome]